MEANPNPITQPNQAPPQAAPVQPAPNIVQQPRPEGDRNKLMLWLIGGLIAIIVVVGGIYFYLSSQQKAKQTPSPVPSARVQENLEKELDSLTVEDIDAEFQTVDKDIESL